MSKLDLALLAFQKDAPQLHKDSSGQYDNKYLSLDALLAAVRPKLNAQGLIVTQSATFFETFPALRTRIVHAESGEALEDIMPLAAPAQNPQAQGSAITYARRYSLMSMLGLVADEDDDGKAATTAAKEQAAASNGEKLVTAAQIKRLFAIAREKNVEEDTVKYLMRTVAGVESSKEISAAKYDALVSAVESGSSFYDPTTAAQADAIPFMPTIDGAT